MKPFKTLLNANLNFDFTSSSFSLKARWREGAHQASPGDSAGSQQENSGRAPPICAQILSALKGPAPSAAFLRPQCSISVPPQGTALMSVHPWASQRRFNPPLTQTTEEKSLSGDTLVRWMEPEWELTREHACSPNAKPSAANIVPSVPVVLLHV